MPDAGRSVDHSPYLPISHSPPPTPAPVTSGRPPRRAWLAALVTLVAASMLGLAFDRWSAGATARAERDRVKAAIQPHANLVVATIAQHVAQITALKTFIETTPNRAQLEKEFEAFGTGMLANARGVRAVELVRAGRIAMVVPRKGNEQALTVEFERHPDPMLVQGYRRARRAAGVTIVGPIQLVQGGVGLILFERVRAPYDPTIELAELVVRLPEMLQDIGVGEPPPGLHLALVDPAGRTVGASTGAVGADPVVTAIRGLDGRWELRGAPVDGWDAVVARHMLPTRVAVVTIIVLLVVLAYVIADREARLRWAVRQRTATLSQLVDEHLATIRLQHETSQALVASEERLRRALETARMHTFEVELPSGRFSWSSNPTEKGSGASIRTLDDAAPFVDPTDLWRLRDALERGRQAPDAGALTFRVVAGPDRARWLAATWRSTAESDGSIRRIAGTLSDVSDRKDLEEQFRHSQKMQAMGALAGGIAHDFNNLLTVILGAAQMARQAVEASGTLPEAREDLDDVLAAADRASVMTGQLLAFSRRQVLQPRRLDAGALVRGMGAMLNRLVGERICVVTETPEVSVPLYIDSGQFTQVVMNLAVNARDAMPEGGALHITLCTDQPAPPEAADVGGRPPGRFALLSVTDTGVGIAPAVQGRIFEPFFTTKPPGQGTGLGLATVHGIVAQLGGYVRVESDLGRGASFHIHLPLFDGPALPAEEAPAPTEETGGARATILVAEDEPGLRRIAERVLQGGGYTVLAAEDGDGALAISRTHAGRIDLLLSDVVMPGMSGLDLASSLLRERPELRVLLMSGYVRDAGVGMPVSLADAPFLAKPFGPADLLAAVRQALADE